MKKIMLYKKLADWLDHIKKIHSKNIDMGLERVFTIAKKMDLLTPSSQVVIVGGTNGKGSTVAGLESIYAEAGYKTGVYSTPFLIEFNEQIRVNKKNVSDEVLCQAFYEVEKARDTITLTQFEFTTLAALEIFKSESVDVYILEVGLGGRLDAVNIMSPDISIITSIDIDHAEWLGDTREKIAIEKAGIFRSNKPVVCGDFNPPSVLKEIAEKLNSPFYCQGIDFGFESDNQNWNWWSKENVLKKLLLPTLLLKNMSTVLMTVELLQKKLPVTFQKIESALKKINLPGRLQVIENEIYDVSHNPASVLELANYLKNNPVKGKNHAVFSMLADKDIASTVDLIKKYINTWHIAALNCERAASLDLLLKSLNFDEVYHYSSIKIAYEEVKKNSSEQDRIIVFGSFHTVSEVIAN